MLRTLLSLIICLSALLPVKAQEKKLTLLFLGDIMQHKPQIDNALENGKYNYAPCFDSVRNELIQADITIANLEVTLAGKPYKGYPQFSSPDALAEELQNSGIDILVTSNNHSCDRGKKGIVRTIKVLDSLNMPHTGTFTDSLERSINYPLLYLKDGFLFAFLNYTYDTNGIPVPSPTIVNLIDTVQIAKDIETAKLYKPDLIIACMHWGLEYKLLPNSEQKQLAEFLINKGVQLVIGGHPHVLQPMEKRFSADSTTITNIVAYSLGNYVSNQSAVNTDGGAMLKVTLSKDANNQIKIDDCQYSLVWVRKPVKTVNPHYVILPAARYEDTPADLTVTEQNKLKTFINNARKLLKNHNKQVDEYKF